MDEAERFVRDAMSYSGVASLPGQRSSLKSWNWSVKALLLRLWRGHDDSGEAPSLVRAPVKPKTPRRRAAVSLPLP